MTCIEDPIFKNCYCKEELCNNLSAANTMRDPFNTVRFHIFLKK